MISLGCSWKPWDWDDCVHKYLGEALKGTIGSLFKFVFDAIKSVVVAAVKAIMETVGTLWIDIDTPNVANNNAVTFIQHYTLWILVFAATISVIIAGIRMAVSQRGEPVRDILRSLLTMVVVSGMGVAFAATLIEIADWFSQEIIDAALDGSSFSERVGNQLVDPLETDGLGLMLVIVIGILLVVTSIVQLVLMVIRYGMLILLVGILPLTASATNTEVGMTWFKRAVSWLAGFILYKPVAALIYATAIKLIGVPRGAEGVTISVLTGVTMMVLAVVALPAILRFVSPKAG